MVDLQGTFIHTTHELMNTWVLEFVFFFMFGVSWEWVKMSPGQMVDLQRGFIHITHWIIKAWFLDFCVLYVVTMGESEFRSNGRFANDFHPHHRWNHEHSIFRIYIFFHVLCVVTMGESESRSNGRLTKGVHPHHPLNYKSVIFGLCVLCVAIMDGNESRSNGRLVKDFHPHHTWNYEHVILRICIFLCFMCCDNGWKWVPVKWQTCKGLSSTPHMKLWTRDF